MNSETSEQPSVIGQLLFGSRRSVFRFETLPAYSMEEERDALEAWKRGDRFDWPQDVLDFVAATREDVARGVKHTRVRLVPNPISKYFRFELAFYPLLDTAGVDVRFIGESEYAAATRLPATDFYAFDSLRVVRMLYDAAGGWLGEAEFHEKERDSHIALATRLMELSLPFAEYSRSFQRNGW